LSYVGTSQKTRFLIHYQGSSVYDGPLEYTTIRQDTPSYTPSF
jgi:hypothetical protein